MGARTKLEPGTPVAPPAKRGRRISAERSEEILDAVLDLLHDSGYDQLRMQDVADKAGVGLATIYRRWPTKQELVRTALECERASEKFVDTGQPRADLRAILRRMADDLSGDGGQNLLGFLATMRAEPEIAEVFRTTSIQRLNDHLRGLLAAELGEDAPDLDLRAIAGPAILMYLALMGGATFDADAVADRLVDLVLEPAPTPAPAPA